MKENVITHLSHKMERLRIRSIPRVKKYLISQETRNLLKCQEKNYLALIPFRSVNLPIYNKSKEFFLHQTEIITKNEKMLLVPPSMKGKNEVNKLQKYMEKYLRVKVPASKITKILDVEASKVKIYVVNLTDFEVSTHNNTENTSEEEEVVGKIKKLSLNEKLEIDYLTSEDFKFQKILNFYNQIKVRYSIKELYQNIGRLPQNRPTLTQFISLELDSDDFTEVKHTLNLKYHFMYKMLADN